MILFLLRMVVTPRVRERRRKPSPVVWFLFLGIFVTFQRWRSDVAMASAFQFCVTTTTPHGGFAKLGIHLRCRPHVSQITPFLWRSSFSDTISSKSSALYSDSLSYLENLNDSQVAAVTQPPASITRVMAGPGSGKTRVLMSRIAHLLQHQEKFGGGGGNILAVTFTKKAAGEMNLRLKKLLVSIYNAKQSRNSREQLDFEPSDEALIVDESDSLTMNPLLASQLRRVTLGTLHSVCAKILRWNGEYLTTLPSVLRHSPANLVGLNSDFAIADQAEQLRVLNDILAGYNERKADIKPKAILTAIASCRDDYARGKDPFFESKKDSLSPFMKLVKQVYDPYRRNIFASNLLDFDDLIYLTRELLDNHEEVRNRMRQRWRHVLVDEFQDTSLAQFDIVRFLTTDSLFVVGDADQSIYSWRGAHVGMMHEIGRHFSNLVTIYLMENYRSDHNIIRAAQKIINSGDRNSEQAKMRKVMKPQREAGLKPRVLSCRDDQDEAHRVVEIIKKAVDSGTYGVEREVAIIYRKNAQSRAFEEACVRLNLPYVIFGSAASFYKRKEIKDSLCFLRWLANGRDRGSMLRAFSTPTRGLGDASIFEFDKYCDIVTSFYMKNLPASPLPTPLEILLSFSNESLLDQGAPKAGDHISTRPRKIFLSFSEQMGSIYDYAKRNSLADSLNLIVQKLEFRNFFEKTSASKAEFEERWENIGELQKASERYTDWGPCLGLPQPSPDQNVDFERMSPLTSFLEDVALVTDMAEETAEAAQRQDSGKRFAVSFMTIHASKGKEFDTVFIVGNEEGTFPSQQAVSEGDGSEILEEEIRLCYVAMTRAKTELVMTWRKEVTVLTSKGPARKSGKRSRFLDVLASPDKRSTQQQEGNIETNDSSARRDVGSDSTHPLDLKEKARPRTVQRTSGSDLSFARLSQKKENTLTRNNRTSGSLSANHGTARVIQNPNNILPRSKATYGKEKSSLSHGNVPGRFTIPTSKEIQTGGGTLQRPPQTPHKLSPANGNDRSIHDNSPSGFKIDSTLLFPVGLEVFHKKLGCGTVLPPPEQHETMVELPVRVKFSTGEHVFSARGSDLFPSMP